MFFNDHNPPHFKVKYSEFEANILIENGTIINCRSSIIPKKHKEELLHIWNSKVFHKIEPLR